MKPVPLAYEMETEDPDDLLTLALLASHPNANLQAVLITPGTSHQTGLVRHVLTRLGREDIPIGSRDPKRRQRCVSLFHYEFFGRIGKSEPDGLGKDILANVITANPATVVVTGAPPMNLLGLIDDYPTIRVDTWVAQGGYAGNNIVPPDKVLDKFRGKRACPSYNFSTKPHEIMKLLNSDSFNRRFLVSKNVCHGLVYDSALHRRIAALRIKTLGLQLIWEAMDLYLKKHPHGKKLHDPLAACTALDTTICEFLEVEPYFDGSKWGANPADQTNTHISISTDHERFYQVFTATNQQQEGQESSG